MTLIGRSLLNSDLVTTVRAADDLVYEDECRALAMALIEGMGENATEEALASLIAWAERVVDDKFTLESILDGSFAVTGVSASVIDAPTTDLSVAFKERTSDLSASRTLNEDELRDLPF
jgi:hypothetical protein